MKKVVACTTLVVALLAIADWINPVREGLNATYFANATWSDPPALSTVDPQPSNERLLAAFRGAPPDAFSTTWAGSFLAMHDGSYALATISDDDSAVYVDGQVVVDNGGRRVWPRGATGLVTLSRGVHAIYVRYAQDGGPFHSSCSGRERGSRSNGCRRGRSRRGGSSFWAFASSAGLKRSLAAAEWVWVASIVAWALTIGWAWIARGKAWLAGEGVWPALKWILAASLILNATGIWWGLPGGSWAPDELTPTLVLGAAAQLVHARLVRSLSAVSFLRAHRGVQPVAVARAGSGAWTSSTSSTIRAADVDRAGWSASRPAPARCSRFTHAGAQTFGSRAGMFAAAMFALVTPFVYYAKTANLDVPYLFWFAVSLVFYLRVLRAAGAARFHRPRGLRHARRLHQGSGVRPLPADARSPSSSGCGARTGMQAEGIR